MIKAVLFDLDGVLVDSETFSREASDAVLKSVGIVQTAKERNLVFGRRTVENYRAAIEARGLKVDPMDVVKKKNRLFAKMIRGKLKPMPGVLDLIGELEDADIRTAVVSSSPLERVNTSLEEVGLLLEFDVIVSGDCCAEGKPNPEPFQLAAQRLNVNPKECVVIEDAEAGILAGKAAGMKVAAVKSPNTHGQDLSKADVVVNSIEDINLSFLNNL
ncbi:MAG: HAD family phosphatase [Candidatus Altiarchaeota archaeon]